MKVRLSSVSVADQAKAQKFYTEVLGFSVKHDVPMGDARYLTLVSPEEPNGAELLLEPNADYPAMKALKESLKNDGIPFNAFEVDDLKHEVSSLKAKGVLFTNDFMDLGSTEAAVFDDTCGNLIMIYQVND